MEEWRTKHTPLSLTKEVHVCADEGCRPQIVNNYRQAHRIDIRNNIEDYHIKHHQSLFVIRSKKAEETNSYTKLQKYYNRITYLLYKTGAVGVYRDSNNNPVFGHVDNKWYNVVGDIIEFDIRIHTFGNVKGSNGQNLQYLYPWKLIKDSSFVIELPRKKGLRDSYRGLYDNTNYAFDNIRINQDNAMIKWLYDAGYVPENHIVHIFSRPAVNNMGLMIVTKEMIPIDIRKKNDDEKKEDEDAIEKFLKNEQGHGLIRNEYQDTTASAIENFKFNWNFMSLMVGIREQRETKKANLLPDEVLYNNFSYDIAENYVLQILKMFIIEWNKFFDEDNYIENTIKDDRTLTENNEEEINTQTQAEPSIFDIVGGNN